MMQFECKKIENCFGDTNIYEYQLKINVDEKLIDRFAMTGATKYYKNFPRPFFQVSLQNGITIKGVMRDCIIKVNFSKKDQEAKQQFELFLEEQINQHIASGERK